MDISNGTSVNDRLRQERIRRNWRQRDLADQLGTTVVTVKRWERGYQQPSTYFRVKLCTLFGKSAEELGLASDVVSEEAVVWSVPFPRNPFFTGRDLVLEQMHAALTGKLPMAALTRSYALHGLGGIGKTQLTIEYAYRHRCAYQAIFWVEAETLASLTSSFVRLAASLALPEEAEEDQRKTVAAVLRWLNRHEGWLLIFDNVENLSLIKSFLPASDQGAILLTTRLQSLGTLAQRLALPPMTIQEGSDFLLARTNRKQYAAVNQQEQAAAQEIIAEMGGLPLALEQAGAYIDATQCSLSEYLHLFRQMQHRLLDEHEPSSDHPLSVNRTFLLAFEQVAQRNPFAAELLTACAFLAPEAIPEMFFLKSSSLLGPAFEVMASDPLAFPEAIKVLLSYSLLQRSAPTRTITIHRLVQAVLKARLTETERRTWGRRVIDAMNRLFPADEGTQANYLSIGEQLITHAQACLLLADQWNEDEAVRVSLMTHIAAFLSKCVCYGDAEPLFERAIQIGERTLGAEHLLVAEALYGLANLHQEQGKYAKAEPLFERVLSIRKQTLAAHHPLVATSLNMLGYCYFRRGKYEQAEMCYQRALHIREEVVDPGHPDIASSLYNLGTLHWRQGKYEQAESLLRRALHIWEQSLGSEHPQVTFPMTALGALSCDQGKYEQAEAYYRQALHIWERVFPEHPRVATSLNNLGALYQEQGKYEQAEDYYRRAFHVWEQMQSCEHPDAGTPLNNLGDLYYIQGRYEQAEGYYRRALRVWEQALGSEHLDIAYVYNGLANLFRDQGRYEQAHLLYHRALALRRQHLGLQHPQIAETFYDLARFHHLQRQTMQALSFYQLAQAIREQIYGLQHPKTEEVQNAITQLWQEMSVASTVSILHTPYRANKGRISLANTSGLSRSNQ